jgi:thiamine kinase-like enzyme
MKSSVIIENKTLSLENISNEIFKIISPIRPDWNASNTRLVKFTEGITNSIIGLFDNRTPDDESKALIVKVFGAHTELFISRQSELDAMIKLSQAGVLSQKVLMQFNNGIIYEYASGKACSREDVRKEKIAELIAIKFAEFHSVPMQIPEKPYIITLIRTFIQLINEDEQQKKG